jgi:hypothetical protein
MIRFPALGFRKPRSVQTWNFMGLFLRRTLLSEEGSPEAGRREPEADSEC